MKAVITALFILVSLSATAQWNYDNQGVIYSNNGNVGIGTSSPTHSLSIMGATQNVLSVKAPSHSIIDIESASGFNSYLRFKNNNGNKWDLASETTGNFRIYDYTAQAPRFLITPNGNVAIGVSDPGNARLSLLHSSAYIKLLPEATGIGNLMQIGRPQGLSLGVTSYGSEQQKLITRIGINYAIDGGDGLTQYAANGTKKAPVIELNAELGAINLYGENGTGSNFRHTTATMNLGLNVSSAGNVGVGVPAGQEKLVVYNNNDQTRVLIGNPNTSTDGFTSLTLGTSANANGYTFLQAIKSAGSAMGDISLNHMGGNVGIGTTAPDGLQVNSVLSQETSRGVNNVRLGLFGNTPRIIFDYAGYTPFQIDNVQDKFRIFTPGQEMLVIKANGNIGIGSTNPDAKLTVNGIIHTREVLVDVNVPGPDYVFEEDYNLLPLTEIEAYISQNKHLPEVPSAKEMEANGLNLKEMNLLLLKKVEELTLHLIEQDKKIKELQENSREKKFHKRR